MEYLILSNYNAYDNKNCSMILIRFKLHRKKDEDTNCRFCL